MSVGHKASVFSRFVKADLHKPSCSSPARRPRQSHSLHFSSLISGGPLKTCHMKHKNHKETSITLHHRTAARFGVPWPLS